jgi:hypothetical protein
MRCSEPGESVAVGNGFARARSLSPAGLLPSAEFLSPFPNRLKCCVPCADGTTTKLHRSADAASLRLGR